MSGGFSSQSEESRLTENNIEKIERINLKNVEFHNEDYVDFINKIDPNSFIFLDPPYYTENKLYGIRGDLHENFDHIKLRSILKKKKRWMLCYNNCKYIRDLYEDYKIINVDWKYGMTKDKGSKEIVVINY